MTSKKQENEITCAPSSAQDATTLPQPTDLKTIFLAGIFLLIFLTTIRVASEIVIPIVLAFILKLVLQPVSRRLEKLRIPRKVAAFLVLALLIGGLGTLGHVLSGPAVSWAEKLPDAFPQLQQRLNFLSKPVLKTQKILAQAEDLTKGTSQKVMPVAVQGTRLSDKIFLSTQVFISGAFMTLFVLFFLLAAGDTFLRRLVEVMPRFKDKRQVVDISQQIECDISSYLLTITMMNACVGIAAGIVMWVTGVEDPILWGTLAFLLNYMPIIGPLVGIMIFFLVGLVTLDNVGSATVPAALYLLIHLTEGGLVTPLLLARRFTLNPVLVILALVFWYWIWGLAGAILAVPMLAITKIICDRIQCLNAFGHFLEGTQKLAKHM